MVKTPPASLPETETPPFWRKAINYMFDLRFLGVLGQIAFILFVVVSMKALGGNFSKNVNRLGESQFVCRDGSFSYRCAFDFMDSEAGFDVSDTPIDYETTDPYWKVFYIGILNTLKVAFLGVILVTIVGTFAGIARLSKNWLVSNLALWYVELMRNTPLLVQLFFIYFGVLLALPNIDKAKQLLGMPIFLSNRGLNYPSPQLTSSASIWMAFLVLAIIQVQVQGIILNRKEERTGQSTNRLGAGIASFLIIVAIGWFVSVAVSDSQGLLVSKASRIQNLEDIEKNVLKRSGLNGLEELSTLSEEEVSAIALQICALRDSASETNLTAQLRAMNIPYEVTRSGRPDQSIKKYEEGKCEVFVAPKTVIAAERATLENPSAHLVLTVREKPIVWSVPVREGLNINGGTKMFPEFMALLIGLVLFYGGSLAEIVRAGILSVTKGQSEAARALGLNESQRLQLVVMPQALRVIIPPLIGIFLSLAKDTSLGVAIGFPDMYAVSYTMMNQSGRILQIFIIMMLVYMLISLAFSLALNWYNERVKLVER